jgi:hypothetical protein
MLVLALLGALVVVGLVGFWILGGGVVAERSARLANGLLLDEDTRITIGWVEGFPLTGLVLKDVRVETRETDGWQSFVTARSVEMRYDPWGLLHRRYKVSRLTLIAPELHLRRRGETGYALPGFRASGKPGSGGAAPRFGIGHFEAVGGTAEIVLPWRAVRIDSLDLAGEAEAADGTIRVDLDRLTGVFADSLGAIELAGSKITIAAVGSPAQHVSFENVRAMWAGSPLSVDGSVAKGAFQFSFAGERFPLGLLGRLLDRGDLGPGFIDRASGTVTGRGDVVNFTWEGAGRWGPWSAESMRGEGELRDDVVRLTGVSARDGEISVDDAVIVVPVRASGIEVQGRFRNVRPDALPIEPPLTVPGTLSGEVHAVMVDRMDYRRGLTVEARLDAGDLYGLLFKSADLRLHGAGDAWTADSARVELEGASVDAKGLAGPEALDLRVRYLGDVKPLRPFVKNETLAGIADLDAVLTGTLKRPVARIEGHLVDLVLGEMVVPRLDLVRAEGPLLEERNLVLDLVAAKGVTFPGFAFDRAQAYLTVGEDAAVVTELEAARGDTVLAATGRVRWAPVVTIDIESAEARSQGRRLWIDTPGTITYANDRLTGSNLVIQTARGSLEAAGVYDVKSRHADASFIFHRLDPSVFFPPDKPLPLRVGSASGTARVSGVFPDVDGSADLDFKAIEWEGGRLDSASARVTLRGRDVDIEELDGWVEGGAMGVRGGIRLPLSLRATLESIAVGPEFLPDSLAFDLAGSLTDVQLGRWLAFVPRPDRPQGRVDAQITLSGTAAAPRIVLRGEGVDLGWRDFAAQGLTAAVAFESGTVRVDTLTLRQGGKRTEVRGTGPLDLTLYPFRWSLPERPLDLRVEAEDGSPDLLRLLPFIGDVSGSFNARVTMTGTPKQPIVDGDASLEKGRISIRDRDEIVENITARVSMAHNLLTIDHATGTLGGGKVRAEGTYRLWVAETEAYALILSGDRAVVRDEGLYAARVSGTLTLRPLRAKDGRIYPYAEGSLYVHRLEYAGSLEPQDLATFRPQPILYQVSIEAPSQVLVRNEQVDAELGGELQVRQDVDMRSVLGELEILRGRYQLFFEQFRITEGTITWSDPYTIIPVMDVTAEATVPPYVIVVRLNGRADEPVVESSALLLDGRADAGLTESEVFQVLAAGSVGLGARTLGFGTGQNGSATSSTSSEALVTGVAAGTTLLGGRIEREVLRRVGLVDEFDIDSGSGESGNFALTLGVRKWLTPALSVAYRQGLSQNFEQDVAVEYRLRRAIFLRAGYARRQTTSLATGLAQEYNLDLKVRHEY